MLSNRYLIVLALIVGWRSSAAYSLHVPTNNHDGLSVSRREVLVETSVAATSIGLASFLANPQCVNAATTTPLTKYEDTARKFSIDVPSDWTQTVQSLPDRRKIILYIKPDSDQKTLMFLAFSPVRDDFTSLSSFGSVDEVAQATILPKGELAGVTGVESEMLSATTVKQAYMFDYTQKVPNQPQTHFRTIFSLATGATGGAGNVLVTITAQTPESEYNSVKPLFDEIIKSYNNT
jgi:hypothetical protein